MVKIDTCPKCSPDCGGNRRPLLEKNGTKCHGCGYEKPVQKRYVVSVIRATYRMGEVSVMAETPEEAKAKAERCCERGDLVAWDERCNMDYVKATKTEVK